MASLLTVDSVVRSSLMTMNLPIHYYVRHLHLAMKCIEELKLGVLQVTKTVRLTVDAYNEVDIPSDYVDWVTIGYERGPYVIPLGERKTINRLPNLDDQGSQIPYGSPYIVQPDYLNSLAGYFPSYHFSQYREQLGKRFGYNDSYRGDTFQVIIERNKIHIGSSFSEGETVVLEYCYFDSTSTQSLVSKYAANYIERFIIYESICFNPKTSTTDKRIAKDNLDKAYRELIARMNPITKDTIVRIRRKNTKQSIKT